MNSTRAPRRFPGALESELTFAFGDDRLPKRFWARVSLSESGCWLWAGAIKRKYPATRDMANWRKQVYAHRLAYEVLLAQVPDGKQLDHLCKTPNCVNPKHLEPVTAQENILRSSGLAAQNAVKTHCKNGHPFSLSNTYLVAGQKRRHCRICRTEWMRHKRQITKEISNGI